MNTMTLKEFQAALKAQGMADMLDMCVVCPMCGTVQSLRDLIEAGAGKTIDEVDSYYGFSCVGRFTHRKPPPSKKDWGTQVGCNWTLGGLFRTHELEVVTPDGKHHPHFMPATPEQARTHKETR